MQTKHFLSCKYTYVLGWVQYPKFFMVAAKSLHYDPKRPMSIKIVKSIIWNQLGLDFKG